MGRAADLDVPQRGLDVEAGAQHDLGAFAQAPQKDRRQRVDVEQRQDADDAVALGPSRLLAGEPGLVHGDGGGQVAVAEDRALRHPGRPARVLEEGDVVGRHLGPGGGRRPAAHEGRHSDDAAAGRDRARRGGTRSPGSVVADDHEVEVAGLEQLFGPLRHAREVGRDQGPGTGIGELVRELALGVERREMDQAQARLRGAEEHDRVKGRVRKIEGERGARLESGRDQRRAEPVRLTAELVVADGPAAELDGRRWPIRRHGI